MTLNPRPHYHFTPPSNWLNDPNGLVYYNGEYHLFYQYHPESDLWGPMHWGHAISRDLVNWKHLPIALFPDDNGMIFSGSAVVDKHNTAGFGEGAMIAVFTHDMDYHESQSLAYSTDNGRTWTKYSANPVLFAPNDFPDFRDPKVFWFGDEQSGHWVMCLAVRDRIMFYVSQNLIHWKSGGEFGPIGSIAGVWETPDLFKLPLDNNEARWVLTIGVQAGAPAGGSGTQYFIGTFDGKTFTTENPPETVLWADFGADYYAAQAWNDAPSGRRLMIGWMNNWDYARLIPSAGWRGAFSIIRELSLTRTSEGIRLIQKPIPEMQSLRQEHQHWQDQVIQPDTNLLLDVRGNSLEIIVEFAVTEKTEKIGFRICTGENEHTDIRYSVLEKHLSVNRTHSGQADFHDNFARVHSARISPINGIIRLHIFVDSTSVEVFANDGVAVITDSIFPDEQSQGVELFAEDGEVLLHSLDIFHLQPATFQIEEDRP